MKLKGTFSISGFSGSSSGVRIEIADDISRCRILVAELTHEALGQALCGSSMQPCEIELYNKAPFGMKAENKTEFVPVKQFSPNPAQSKAALKPFEVDGWKARSGDLGNHHHFVRLKDGTEGFMVVFFRHVKPDGTPVLR